MAAFLLSENLEIIDAVKMDEYRALIGPQLRQFGGAYRAVGQPEVVEGEWQPRSLVLIEFEDMAALRRWYDSAEYAPLKELRLAASRSNIVLLEGR